jgi:hypothetical protein
VNKEIDKQKFMRFVSKAFDNGADIQISFYSSKRNEEEAKGLCNEFAAITGTETEEVYGTDYKSRWFKNYGKYQITAWHENSHDKKYLKEHLENILKETEEIDSESITAE